MRAEQYCSPRGARDRIRTPLFAGKYRGYALPLGDPLGGVDRRQEGQLAHGLGRLAGNRNGKAKRMFRLPVFLAKLDENVAIARRNLVSRGDVFHFRHG